MPVTGRKPQAETLSRRRARFDWTEVPDEPFTAAPRLPRTRPDGTPWPEHIRRKWRAWSRMPHCVLWQPSDWDFALDTLEVAARFSEGGSAAYATELRARERVLGTTADARRDLRVQYVAPRLATLRTVTPPVVEDFADL
jgi:hypothetical protein